MIQSYQSTETWRYCYVDDQKVTDAESPAR